jgi:hypothetical protein
MCARISNVEMVPAAESARVTPPEPAKTISPVEVGTVAPALKAEPAKAEAPKAVAKSTAAATGEGLVATTYRSKKMFSENNGQYLVAITRENKAAVNAVDIRMTLTVKGSGQVIGKIANRSGETQKPGAADYYGLSVPKGVVDAILDGPENEPGTELEWNITYKLEGDDAKRCFSLRAVPRRRDPEGITWIKRGSSASCPADDK